LAQTRWVEDMRKMVATLPQEELEARLREVADRRAELIKRLPEYFLLLPPLRSRMLFSTYAELARLKVEQQILLLRLRALKAGRRVRLG